MICEFSHLLAVIYSDFWQVMLPYISDTVHPSPVYPLFFEIHTYYKFYVLQDPWPCNLLTASHLHPHPDTVSTPEFNTCIKSNPPLHPLLRNSHQQTGSQIQTGLREVLWQN